jgi:hypothetical protein
MKWNVDWLDEVRVASPCHAEWDEMLGDERVRFCGQCEKHVYNLSALSRREAASLVLATEERLCVRFYQRRDGTMLTDNCPVGLRSLRRALLLRIGGLAAAVPALAAFLGRRSTAEGAGQAERRNGVMGSYMTSPDAMMGATGAAPPAPLKPAIQGKVRLPMIHSERSVE